ncbi:MULTISPECIES: DUF3992 domain-containing protein [unclassified Lysinibacillus]|uniref:DUF3992 domain-containing protein n=1 Tax=unclassified Lysinibacillus TaxID=2636778 RepID=UPI00117194ED|nr:S-Ena type endospore appendage [Lysinibacillus sp. CD3-6]QPQ36743.1 DUF3992 domain-containing protein [Lysinibacillus sp. JNUCC-52]UED81523.1 DUF3992 domain-containing protein [Lysinibacillus sp. CD3-6]
MCQGSNGNIVGNFSCCEPKKYVQDKVCNSFTVAGDDVVGAEIIYATNANEVIFASGFIKNIGNFPLTIQFVKGADPVAGTGGTVVRQTAIPIGGAFTFTISRFDTIRVFATGATEVLPAAGEFCITPRYELS